MSLPKTVVDGFLVAWDAGEYEAQVKPMGQKSQALRPVVPALNGTGGKSRPAQSNAQRAQAVRDRLSRTVRKVPEVMVKITSACKGMTQIGRHIDYISRKGQIELEDQDGLILRGKDQLKDIKADWRSAGPEEIGQTSDRRDTLNIVLSMPAHTDEVSLKRAVRAFAATEFEGHQYVFAYHTQVTDPDPDPPAHPHVHLSVKTQGWSGRRLNPRKADLQRWREGFAEQLRAHGIEANATSRLARLQSVKGPNRAQLAIADREGRRAVDPADMKSSTTGLEAKRLQYYEAVTRVLARSELTEDRALARALAAHFKGIGRSKDPDSTTPRDPRRDQDR